MTAFLIRLLLPPGADPGDPQVRQRCGSVSGGVGIALNALLFLGKLLSGLATGASWICYFRALQLGSVNQVAPIDKSSTVLTMLLAFLLLRERISLNMLLGMGLILGGTLLMLQRQGRAGGEGLARLGGALRRVCQPHRHFGKGGHPGSGVQPGYRHPDPGGAGYGLGDRLCTGPPAADPRH